MFYMPATFAPLRRRFRKPLKFKALLCLVSGAAGLYAVSNGCARAAKVYIAVVAGELLAWDAQDATRRLVEEEERRFEVRGLVDRDCLECRGTCLLTSR